MAEFDKTAHVHVAQLITRMENEGKSFSGDICSSDNHLLLLHGASLRHKVKENLPNGTKMAKTSNVHINGRGLGS